MSASNEILTSSGPGQYRDAVASGGISAQYPENLIGARLNRLVRITALTRSLIVLAKPEITMMVMISAGFASLMASGSLRITVLVHIIAGIGLLAAGAAALNQY